jgi:hypothetical protein
MLMNSSISGGDRDIVKVSIDADEAAWLKLLDLIRIRYGQPILRQCDRPKCETVDCSLDMLIQGASGGTAQATKEFQA